MSPEEQKIAEALLEVEGEKFSDKLRLVKAVNKIVVGETDVLLKILKKTEEKEATSQVQEPEAEQEQETPEQETANESLLREMSQNEALAIKEQALKVHDEMIKIKDSSHQHSHSIQNTALIQSPNKWYSLSRLLRIILLRCLDLKTISR